jgi:hypothetical protein
MRRSSHYCLGGWDPVPPTQSADLGSVDAPWSQLARNQHERGCLFRNICFTGSGNWNYYASPDEFQEAETLRAGVDVWSRGGFGRDLPPRDRTFHVVHGSLPEAAGWLETPTLVHVSLFAPSNVGHFLGNGLFPAFHAVWRFLGATAATQPSMQLLFAGPNQTDLGYVRRQRQRCDREANTAASGAGSSPQHRACLDERTPQLVSKFIAELLPALSDAPALWESSVAAMAKAEPSGLVCARRVLVGVGGLSFATVFEHGAAADGAGGSAAPVRRRPPLLLWGDFIEHLSRRLLRDDAILDPPSVVLITKRGRRAPTARAFARLGALLAQVLPLPVRVLDPAALSMREQLRAVGRAPLGITPDGGTSLLGAFLPAGASLIVLGSLERWMWANDRRVRAFYCTPPQRERTAACEASDSRDCYEAEAVLPCITNQMLPRALAHATATWPDLRMRKREHDPKNTSMSAD